ncbi:MAG TPA: CYTH domain-containing protein, partial [Mycobacterium sp.]|nr:CYTH domain-containing protein [Mycobacterium sp.]
MASSTTSTEVERKFDVDDAVGAPSWEGIVAGVRAQPIRSLDADYFDTAAGDLATHQITLRRRSGGPDAGWHLKLPAGPDARTEVRLPLEACDTPPDELVDVVAAIVRDRPLAPVARIATTRAVLALQDTDGTVLAEFCDDRVAGWTIGPAPVQRRWREWEVEVVTAGTPGADRELLEQLCTRVQEAGARPARHGSKLARLLPGAPAATTPADPLQRAIAEQVEALTIWD